MSASPGTLNNNLAQTPIEDALAAATGATMQGEQPLLWNCISDLTFSHLKKLYSLGLQLVKNQMFCNMFTASSSCLLWQHELQYSPTA